MTSRSNTEPIAIIGMGCRFPGGADSPALFWELLQQGFDAVGEIPADRWNWRRYYDPQPDRPRRMYIREAAFVRQPIDRFDAQCFGISAREASQLDPQQRLLLEVTWEAFEDAGLPLSSLAGSPTGVFVGGFNLDHKLLLMSDHNLHNIGPHSSSSSTMAMLANRLSHVFDLRGPSVSLDTACSSSLVAVHSACQSLWTGDSRLAIAGGVNVMTHPGYAIGMCKGRFLSPSARCRAFDHRADGYVRGEGAGIVVLKPLNAARADGDRIHALIRGSAVTQDGGTDGLTVPRQTAQEDTIRRALTRGGVAPTSVQYVEAHGTGTAAGDPIEARALSAALAAGRDPATPCLVGSAKTNIGHTEAAAGIAGLIKTVLCLAHRQIPPHLHLERENPEIPLGRLGLRIPTALEAWPTVPGPRRAGVNSFGYGGTNAHVVLEEAPPTDADRESPRPQPGPEQPTLVPLSARSPEALQAYAADLVSWLDTEGSEPSVDLVAIARQAAARRTHHRYRAAVVAQRNTELTDGLAALALGRTHPSLAQSPRRPQTPKLLFVYSGMGPQWWGMGRELLETEPRFREVIEACDRLHRPVAGWSLLEELTVDRRQSRVSEPAFAQPLSFALQLALTALWDAWGVRPAAVLGHSVGEIAAAQVAGALTLEDAVPLVYHRGRLLQRLESTGAMLAVSADRDVLESLLVDQGGGVETAAVNGPSSYTLSGPTAAVGQLEAALQERGLSARRLRVGVAYHSRAMDPLEPELRLAWQGVRPRAPQLPLYSTVTGQAVEIPVHDHRYWWRNMRQPVQFASAVERALADGYNTCLEIGAHPVLASALHDCAAQASRKVAVYASLVRKRPERRTLLNTLAGLYASGLDPSWEGLHPSPQPWVDLPTYAWQRTHHWSESVTSRRLRLGDPGAHPLLEQRIGAPQPTWQVALDAGALDFLQDHCVADQAVFPGAAYVEVALALARAHHGTQPCVVEQLELRRPLTLEPGREPTLRTTFDPDAAVFTVDSHAHDDEERWVAHARGVLRPATPPPVSPLDRVELRRRCRQEIGAESLYRLLRERGLQYGPRFQQLRRLWHSDDEVLAEIQTPAPDDEGGGGETRFLMHPAVLDAALQSLVAICAPEVARDQATFVPVRLDRIQHFAPPTGRVWCHARLTARSADGFEAELQLFDDDGNPIITLQGVRFGRLPVPSSTAPSTASLLYDWCWEAVDAAPPVPATSPVEWLVLDGEQPPGPALRTELERRGHRCRRPADRTRKQPLEVVWLCGLQRRQQSDPVEATQESCLELVRLLRDLAQHEHIQGVTVVTRGAQVVHPGEPPAAPAQAALWGLMRVAGNELSGLRCRLLDLDPHPSPRPAVALTDALETLGPETELALRQGRRYVHRLRRRGDLGKGATPLPTVSTDDPVRLSASALGTLEGFAYHACERRAPGPGEVEMRVHAAGLNFKDILKKMGLLSERVVAGTFTGDALGMECAGTVVRLGPGVQGVRVGDRVVTVAPGCFQAYLTTDAALLFPMLSESSFEEEAGTMLVFLTAQYALREVARLRPGERILIHAATGGVGLAALQIADAVGAEVFATAGSDFKRDLLRRIGVKHVMDSRSLDFVDELRAATGGQGVDVVLNSLSGHAMRASWELLAPYGRFIELGKREIDDNDRLPMRPFNQNLTYAAVDIDRLLAEKPAYCIDVMRQVREGFDDGILGPLPVTSFAAAEVEQAFRYLAQALHVGKVVLRFDDQSVEAVPLSHTRPFHAKASYLITGGLGGFGLALARWAAAHGARHLVLASRRGAESEEAGPTIDALRTLGCQVRVQKLDVADAGAVHALVRELAAGDAPLAGVFHAAMVLEDAGLDELTPESLARVLDPKARGAWNLHEATEGLDLDHFVLFSSVSALVGNVGQASYAAANAFVNGLAAHRRAQGRAGLAVCWGAIADVGVVARDALLGEHLERMGVRGMPVDTALEALGGLLGLDPPEVAAVDVDWARWAAMNPAAGAPPCFAHLAAEAEAQSANEGAEDLQLLSRLRSVPEGKRLEYAEARMRPLLARVLGDEETAIDPDRPLAQLGLDSLMAAELQALLFSRLGLKMPALRLLQGPSLAQLAASVVRQSEEKKQPLPEPGECRREVQHG